MTTSRKRYPSQPIRKPIDEIPTEISTEMEEVIPTPVEIKEEEVVVSLPEPLVKLFVAEEITPTPDPGPRFLDKVEDIAAPVKPKSPGKTLENSAGKKRHPRNIPKFSRNSVL